MSRSPAVILYDAFGVEIALGNPGVVGGHVQSSFSPDPVSYGLGEKSEVLLDAAGSLQLRGSVHTDEGSFRDHFLGSVLTTALTGTPSFTNGSTTVTGSGTSFTTEVTPQQYIKRDSDGEGAWVQISSVISDTELELVETYAGTTGASASSSTNWVPVTASGGTISVSSSKVSVTNGLANGAMTCIHRSVDYGPLSVQFMANCGTRVANQDVYVGLVDSYAAPSERCIVLFDSALGDTQVVFRTTLGSDSESTTVTLPNGGVTTIDHRYEITQTGHTVTLHIDGVIAAQHRSVVPWAYTVMLADVCIENTAAVGSSTTLAVHWFSVNNANRIEVASGFAGEPLYAQISGKNPYGLPQAVGVGAAGGLFVQPVEYPTFQAVSVDTALANNKSLMSLVLSSSSTQLLKLRAIYIRNTQTTAVTGVVVSFDLEKITGHSGGASITPTSRDSADKLPVEVTARTGATVTGAGSRLWRWEWSSDEWGSGTLDAEAHQVAFQNVFPVFAKKDPALKPFTVRPNEGYHIKCATNTTAGSFDLIFVFTLEDD